MIAFSEIKDVHLEISTMCNARCPLCSRNFYGYPYNDGYPEINLTLENTKKIFSVEFVQQLEKIWFQGNLGEAIINPEAIDIVQYFRNSNPNLKLEMSTNGSARDKNFWESLAQLNIDVDFCLDGLEDTHHIYRQGTEYQKILQNAQYFILAGGRAFWRMIKFKHNQHQIEACETLSKTLGFTGFKLMDEGRNSGPVFDRDGNLVASMGDYTHKIEFKKMLHAKKTDLVLLEDIIDVRTPKNKISCKAQQAKSIYVSANGEISPCCWLGFYPKTFGHGSYHQAVNKQISTIANKNNALEYPLEQCLNWFSEIENSWHISSYEQGRLVTCDDYCGSN